jgi:hypothetical protein
MSFPAGSHLVSTSIMRWCEQDVRHDPRCDFSVVTDSISPYDNSHRLDQSD